MQTPIWRQVVTVLAMLALLAPCFLTGQGRTLEGRDQDATCRPNDVSSVPPHRRHQARQSSVASWRRSSRPTRPRSV